MCLILCIKDNSVGVMPVTFTFAIVALIYIYICVYFIYLFFEYKYKWHPVSQPTAVVARVLPRKSLQQHYSGGKTACGMWDMRCLVIQLGDGE